MKTNILLTIGLMISISCFSQKHNNLTLVPSGSFSVQDAGTPMTISIDNFWMSNEISNKEFREFYNQTRNSPNDSIAWIDFSGIDNIGVNNPKIIKVAYSDIIDKLMNESAWKSVFEEGDYFTNPKYDNYPVIGVTWDGARYYCIWRTKEENKKLKGQDKTLQVDYRLPTEYEWEYALSFNDSKSNGDSNELRQINDGNKNKLGLFNLNSNVSEWTSSSGSGDSKAYKVVKGSSWKSDSKDTQRQLVLPDKGTDYIGFRIVKSDIKK
jgi:formylglycine-generating enzyme required for sulfatase activity